jgi:hypothetical protein
LKLKKGFMIQLFYDSPVKDVIRFLQLLQVPVCGSTVHTALHNTKGEFGENGFQLPGAYSVGDLKYFLAG